MPTCIDLGEIDGIGQNLALLAKSMHSHSFISEMHDR